MVTVSEYRIRMHGIRFRAQHGVSREERGLPQDFVVHVEAALPTSALPAADRLDGVFDYGAIATLVVEEGTREPIKLLETLAGRIVQRVLRDTPATEVRVEVKKFGPPTAHSVEAVSVELLGSRS
jgi:dihydroneopterin aldolase